MSSVNVETATDVIKSFNEYGENAVYEAIREKVLERISEVLDITPAEDAKDFIPNMLVFSVTLTNALIEYLKAIEEARRIPKN